MSAPVPQPLDAAAGRWCGVLASARVATISAYQGGCAPCNRAVADTQIALIGRGLTLRVARD